jgi:hypothetical protein
LIVAQTSFQSNEKFPIPCPFAPVTALKKNSSICVRRRIGMSPGLKIIRKSSNAIQEENF